MSPVAHMACLAESGFLRVVFRYSDHTTRTVLVDPVTKAQRTEATGTAELDEHGAPTPTWWNG